MSLKSTLLSLLPSAPKTQEELRKVASEAAVEIFKAERLTAERDEAVEAVKAPYDSLIIQSEKLRDSLVAKLKAWALTNRAEFGGRKTHIVAGHALAFRTSPGKLENTAKDDAVIDQIIGSEDGELLEIALTVSPSLDKKSIKAALEGGDEAMKKKLTDLGFRIEKPEAFKFEPSRAAQ
jgi:hypothetical protein